MKLTLEQMFAVFTTQFGKPTSPQPQAFLDAYRHTLKFASANHLGRAVELFLRENEVHAWPQPATILKFLKQAVAEQETRNVYASHASVPQLEAPQRTAEQRARVNAEYHRFKAAMEAKSAASLARHKLPPVDRDAWEQRAAPLSRGR